jgi:hypothetical protein
MAREGGLSKTFQSASVKSWMTRSILLSRGRRAVTLVCDDRSIHQAPGTTHWESSAPNSLPPAAIHPPAQRKSAWTAAKQHAGGSIIPPGRYGHHAQRYQYRHRARHPAAHLRGVLHHPPRPGSAGWVCPPCWASSARQAPSWRSKASPGSGMRILLYLLWHCAEETVRPAIPAVAPSVVPRAGGGRIALVAEDEALGRRTPDPRRMAGASRRNRGGGAGAGARLGDAPRVATCSCRYRRGHSGPRWAGVGARIAAYVARVAGGAGVWRCRPGTAGSFNLHRDLLSFKAL